MTGPVCRHIEFRSVILILIIRVSFTLIWQRRILLLHQATGPLLIIIKRLKLSKYIYICSLNFLNKVWKAMI